MLVGRSQDPLPLYPLAAGVDLFFVISGFIMVYSSEDMFGRSGAPRTFLLRRIARIVPLYWVLSAAAIFIMRTPVTTEIVIKSFLFIPYLGPSGAMQPLYGVGWTLNFEMFFYLLFAAAILLPREAAGATAAFALLAGIAAGYFLQPSMAILQFWSDPIVVEFAFGIMLAIACRRGLSLPRWAGAALCVAGAAAIWHSFPQNPPTSRCRWLECGVPAAMIFAGIALQPPLTPRVFRWFAILGDASYSMYLLHSLVLSGIIRLWSHGLNTYPMRVVLLCGFLLTVVASIASYHVFEMPAAKALRGLRPGRSRRLLERPVA